MITIHGTLSAPLEVNPAPFRTSLAHLVVIESEEDEGGEGTTIKRSMAIRFVKFGG